MSNVDKLKKQHSDILALIQQIDTLAGQDLKNNAKEIAFQINSLSGKLKMHLMSEDQFLYPSLMNSENSSVKNTAQKFNQEMGGLADKLGQFVQNFNTASKILQNEGTFTVEAKKMFQLIIDRTNREDRQLYPLIDGTLS